MPSPLPCLPWHGEQKMSKRSCPRSMSTRVIGTGKSFTNFPSRPMPPYIALSSRKQPRATVSEGSGRALCPLAKNWLSESGLVFAWSYISLRHATTEMASIAAPSALGVDIGHLHRLDAQEKEMRALA